MPIDCNFSGQLRLYGDWFDVQLLFRFSEESAEFQIVGWPDVVHFDRSYTPPRKITFRATRPIVGTMDVVDGHARAAFANFVLQRDFEGKSTDDEFRFFVGGYILRPDWLRWTEPRRFSCSAVYLDDQNRVLGLQGELNPEPPRALIVKTEPSSFAISNTPSNLRLWGYGALRIGTPIIPNEESYFFFDGLLRPCQVLIDDRHVGTLAPLVPPPTTTDGRPHIDISYTFDRSGITGTIIGDGYKRTRFNLTPSGRLAVRCNPPRIRPGQATECVVDARDAASDTPVAGIIKLANFTADGDRSAEQYPTNVPFTTTFRQERTLDRDLSPPQWVLGEFPSAVVQADRYEDAAVSFSFI